MELNQTENMHSLELAHVSFRHISDSVQSQYGSLNLNSYALYQTITSVEDYNKTGLVERMQTQKANPYT